MDQIIFCVNGNIHKSIARQLNCTMCAKNSSETTKIKEICTKCDKLCKNIKYHKCPINFKQYEEDAWLGDAIHTVDIIRYLQLKGYSRSCSNVLLTKYKCKQSQVDYLLSQDIIKKENLLESSLHKLSSIFEAKYKTSENFRQIYINTVLQNIKRNQ